MTETEGRYLIGAILVSFGTTYILSAANLTNSSFWLFVGCLFVMESAYYSAKGFFSKRNDVSLPLATLFFGMFVLLFSLNFIRCSFPTLIDAMLISIGSGVIVSELITKRTPKRIISGIVLVLLGILALSLSSLGIADKVDRWLKVYGIGIFIIILGILIIIFPRKENRNEMH